MKLIAAGCCVAFVLALLSSLGCSQNPPENRTAAHDEDTASQPAPQIALRLPASLEARRVKYEATLSAALGRIQEFARSHNWARHATESFMDSVVIFDAKEDFDRALLHITGSDPETVLPATYCAALENRMLLAVSPELYAQVYPEGIEDDSYEKLLTHEIAHRLHIRILSGDENAMGPVWFFEGFALYAADQLKTPDHELSVDEIWRVVGETERSSYGGYASAFRYFASKAPLQELVKRASDTDFTDWLHGLEGK